MKKNNDSMVESLQREVAMLRKHCDELHDKYNLTNTQIAVEDSSKFFEHPVKKQIRTTSDLMRFVSEIYANGIVIINRKNQDYGDHKNADPFGNFRRHGLKGFLVRIDDKLARLNTFCDSGKLAVMDESVMDTIIDAANYLAIMAAFIYSMETESGKTTR